MKKKFIQIEAKIEFLFEDDNLIFMSDFYGGYDYDEDPWESFD